MIRPSFFGFKSRMLFILLLSMVPTINLFAQKVIKRPFDIKSQKQYSPGGLLDYVFDNMGNKYSVGEIAINDKIRNTAIGSDSGPESFVVPSGCSSGYFQLYLETGCGFEGTDTASVARLNVLCRVFYDISQFINSPCTTTGQKVNIWVKNYSGIGSPGVGSPFYNIPYSMTKSGIADNTAWITLNSGVDAFKNVSAPLSTSGGGSSGSAFFHASIRFDCSSVVAWHTDLTTVPAAGAFDLYTCALHEVMHVLGFGTLIDYNGQSVIGPGWQYYTRYDQHLQTQTGTSLITSAATCTQKYQNAFNTALTPATTLSPGGWIGGCSLGYSGSLSDSTPCGTAVQYVGATTVKVYTPLCFEKGSSLSHFEDQCYIPPSWFTSAFPLSGYNNHYFTMSNSGAPGPFGSSNPAAMKRYPKPEERLALCDMGYNVNTTFGTAVNRNYYNYGGSACAGTGVAGINDGITSTGGLSYTSTGGPISISASALLSNDFGVAGGSITCVEVVNGAGAVMVSGGTVTFTPGSGDFGVQLLRYIPKSAIGTEGNITYVYVYIGDTLCTATSCDIVSNGSFENAIPGAHGSGMPGLRCWQVAAPSPDLFTRGSPHGAWTIPTSVLFTDGEVHPFSSGVNDHFVGFVAGRGAPGSPFASESIQNPLSVSLDNGSRYVVSFWLKYADSAGHSLLPSHIQFGVSPIWPMAGIPFSTSGLPVGISPFCAFPVQIYDSMWHYYSQVVTYSGPVSRTLVVTGAPWLDPTTGPYAGSYSNYFVIDDVSVKPESAMCTFTLPDSICPGNGYIDLSSCVGIPGGTFKWKKDSSGVTVVTNSTMFDPVAAFNATVLTRHPGRITVAYTYTDLNGCVNSVYAQTTVLDTTASGISGATSVFVGGTSTLTDATPGGAWTSDNTSVATVGSLTGIVTGVAAGTTTITYTLPSGCYVTISFVVLLSTIGIYPVAASCAEFLLLPNPNKGSFTISGSISGDAKELEAEIQNILGTKVFNCKMPVRDGKVNTNIDLEDNIPNGIYILKAKSSFTSQAIRFTLNR